MWVKLDDAFADHPKMALAGPLAMVIQVRALCYASRHLTDGFIPAGAVHYFLAGFESLTAEDESGQVTPAGSIDWAARMVEYGLWDRVKNGYAIHDFLDFNPAKIEVLADRQKAKDRLARMRKKGATPEHPADDVRLNTGVSSPDVTGDVTPFVRPNIGPCNAAPAPAPAPVPTPEPAPEPSGKKRRVSGGVVKPPPDDGEESPVARTWDAYAAEFERRYGKPPVRNGMVHGQLAQLVKRLGAEEAPLVASFYVQHNDRYYVRKNHTVGPLLHDAEGLRNQWARGTRTTLVEIKSAEQKDSVTEQVRRVRAMMKEA